VTFTNLPLNHTYTGCIVQFFKFTFPDGTSEVQQITLCPTTFEPKVYFTDHTNPKAGVIYSLGHSPIARGIYLLVQDYIVTVTETTTTTAITATTETTIETTTITTSEPSYNYFSLTMDRVSHDASGCKIVVSFSTRNAYVMETNQRFKQIISYLNNSTIKWVQPKCSTGIEWMYCFDYSLIFDLKGEQERQVQFDICKDSNTIRSIWFEDGCMSLYTVETSPDLIVFIESILAES
jgi:hypothetical protein